MPNKYVFVLKPKINRLWSLTAWVQILGVIYHLCDFEQVTQVLCASLSLTGK